MEIVEVKKGTVFCDSNMVAKKFGVKHADVVNKMKTIIPKLEDFRVEGFYPKYWTEDRNYRGKDYLAYLMNRDCFMILGMRFDTKRSRKWQGQFVAAFNVLENRVLTSDENATDKTWLGQRDLGKIARREETDVIKEFVEYAKAQGSKKAGFYYKHITNATYKALGLMVQKKPKLRDFLNLYEVSELLLAERVAKNSLRKYMDLEREYHDIYNSVKDDLISFGSGLKIE
jgi:Rha family phage regulatory protein